MFSEISLLTKIVLIIESVDYVMRLSSEILLLNCQFNKLK